MSDLAQENEPLQLANGMSINPSDGSVIDDFDPADEYIEVPSNKEAVREITAVNRTISDLPDIPDNMNSVAVIMCYTLFGLSDIQIGIATKLTEEQIKNIKSSDVYSTYNDEIVETIVKQEQSNVRNIFSNHAHTAANKIVKLVGSKNEGIAISAAKDILDRDGHRPADVVEHRLTMDDTLEIIHVFKDETKSNQLPVIEIIKE